MKNLIHPLESISKSTFFGLILIETLFFLFLWFKFGVSIIPSPFKVFGSVFELVKSSEFYDALFASLFLTLKAMVLSSLIAVILSYGHFIQITKILSLYMLKFRFVPLPGLVFLFTLLTKDGSQLKLSLLIAGMVPFFVTSLVSNFESINAQEFELCKTLRMNNWQSWLEVIVIGRLDQVIETMRQNFAITWLMITMIESLSMSEGGLGVMVIKANKYINLPKVFALLIVIFIIGIFFDYILGKVREWLFPYTKIGVVAK